jgi:hypothetical protein
MKRLLLALSIFATSIPATTGLAFAQGKIDRLILADAEMQRCLRYFLSTPSQAQLLRTLNVSIPSLCDCVTPIFVPELSDDEITLMYAGKNFPTQKFWPIVRQCAQRLMR